MHKNLLIKILAFGIVVLFFGIGFNPNLAAEIKTSFDSSNNIFERERCGKISENLDELEISGFYRGLIIGRICNVQGSESRITFLVIEVNIYPSGQKLTNVDAWINKPYLGILTSKFILVLGIIYSGW